MLIVCDLQSTHQITNIAIRRLVQKRINDLGGESFDSNELGYFLVVEARDTIAAIQTQVGFNILYNRLTGIRFEATGFNPSFEFIEEFVSCYDMVLVLDDTGIGIEFFVPKEEDINTELIAMCKQHAFRSEESKQATIYVTEKALATVGELVGLDECDRDYLNAKPEPRLNQQEGYYLSTESMRLAVLPVDAEVVRLLSPRGMETYCRHVSFPPELRGVVFSGAPRLPANYASILGYWSPLQITTQHDGAQNCQNLLSEYAVPEIAGYPQDALLSNAVVACIQNVRTVIAGMTPQNFIEIHIPVDAEMLGMDREKFDSCVAYDINASLSCDRIYLKVQDVLESPNPDFIAIAVLHTENHDADYNL